MPHSFRKTRAPIAFLLAGTLVFPLISCNRDEKQFTTADLVQQAWADFRIGDYDRAIERFNVALKQSDTPDGRITPAALDALYGCALTHSLSQTPEAAVRARALFAEILARAPKSDQAAWSLLALARMADLATDADSAANLTPIRDAYQRVIDQFPTHPAARESLLHQQATFVATLDPDDAKHALEALVPFVASSERDSTIAAAHSLMAVCHRTLGEADKEVAARKAAIDARQLVAGPRSDNAAAFWTLAATAEFEAGDFATARVYYNRLITEYPADMRAYGAKLALQRMADLEAKLRATPTPIADTHTRLRLSGSELATTPAPTPGLPGATP